MLNKSQKNIQRVIIKRNFSRKNKNKQYFEVSKQLREHNQRLQCARMCIYIKVFAENDLISAKYLSSFEKFSVKFYANSVLLVVCFPFGYAVFILFGSLTVIHSNNVSHHHAK